MVPTLTDMEPQAGDLIEIFRGCYQHWALYIADGVVVHLVPHPEIVAVEGHLNIKATVEIKKLCDVAHGNHWQVNNSLDEEYKPRPVQLIVREACSMVGTELGYDLLSWNCEHFVTDLRYGKAESRQVHGGIIGLLKDMGTLLGVALENVLFGSGSKGKKSKSGWMSLVTCEAES